MFLSQRIRYLGEVKGVCGLKHSDVFWISWVIIPYAQIAFSN